MPFCRLVYLRLTTLHELRGTSCHAHSRLSTCLPSVRHHRTLINESLNRYRYRYRLNARPISNEAPLRSNLCRRKGFTDISTDISKAFISPPEPSPFSEPIPVPISVQPPNRYRLTPAATLQTMSAEAFPPQPTRNFNTQQPLYSADTISASLNRQIQSLD